MGAQIDLVPGILQEASVRGLKFYITPRTTVRKLNDYLGTEMIIKHQLHFRTE